MYEGQPAWPARSAHLDVGKGFRPQLQRQLRVVQCAEQLVHHAVHAVLISCKEACTSASHLKHTEGRVQDCGLSHSHATSHSRGMWLVLHALLTGQNSLDPCICAPAMIMVTAV